MYTLTHALPYFLPDQYHPAHTYTCAKVKQLDLSSVQWGGRVEIARFTVDKQDDFISKFVSAVLLSINLKENDDNLKTAYKALKEPSLRFCIFGKPHDPGIDLPQTHFFVTESSDTDLLTDVLSIGGEQPSNSPDGLSAASTLIPPVYLELVVQSMKVPREPILITEK